MNTELVQSAGFYCWTWWCT